MRRLLRRLVYQRRTPRCRRSKKRSSRTSDWRSKPARVIAETRPGCSGSASGICTGSCASTACWRDPLGVPQAQRQFPKMALCRRGSSTLYVQQGPTVEPVQMNTKPLSRKEDSKPQGATVLGPDFPLGSAQSRAAARTPVAATSSESIVLLLRRPPTGSPTKRSLLARRRKNQSACCNRRSAVSLRNLPTQPTLMARRFVPGDW